MTPEQIVAILALLADMRLHVEALSKENAELNHQIAALQADTGKPEQG